MAREVMFLVGMLHMTYAYVTSFFCLVSNLEVPLTRPEIYMFCFTDQYSCNHQVNLPAQKET
jgi:hypothetical protein